MIHSCTESKSTGKYSKRRQSANWNALQQSQMDKRNSLIMKIQKINELRANVYPSIMLEITYYVETVSHSGYCSDPDDNTEIVYKTCKEIVNLPTIFKKGDIYVNGFNTRSIHPKNTKLLELFSKNDLPCDKGSGHCGYKTRFSIKETKVYCTSTICPDADISESDFV